MKDFDRGAIHMLDSLVATLKDLKMKQVPLQFLIDASKDFRTNIDGWKHDE